MKTVQALALGGGLLALGPCIGAAQLAPLGPDFEVRLPNGYYPAIGSDASGGFVVVWDDYYPDGDAYRRGVVARRFDESAVPVGPAFLVNSYTTDSQEEADVSVHADGSFVVVWQSYDQDGDNDGVFAQRFDELGAPAGGEFIVNTYVDESQRRPAIAGDDDGGFVVAWQSYNQNHGSDDEDVFGQRFDADGNPEGVEFAVNVNTIDYQRRASVAVLESGEFVVAFDTDDNPSPYDRAVALRRFDASGAPVGGEIIAGYGNRPRIAAGPSGFVVVWEENYEVYGRRYDDAAAPLGAAFQVNTYTTLDQDLPEVAVDGDGRFLVVWESQLQDGTSKSIFGQAYDATGSPLGGEFAVNGHTTGYQAFPDVTADEAGRFVVVWQGVGASGYGLFGRRFGTLACPLSPLAGCKQPTLEFKGRLTIRDKTADKSDSLTWKWVKGEATTVGELGDPLTSESYRFCLYDAGGSLLSEATVDPGGTCGTRPCWKDLEGLGFKFSDGTGVQDGARVVVLKSGIEGKAKVVFKAKGTALRTPSPPLALPLLAQLAGSSGTCFEAAFEPAGVLDNVPHFFAGKAGFAGSPSGAFVE